MSLVLLLSVALYYWRAQRRKQTVYDDIARQQVEAAAKLDKLSGLGDGKVTEMDLHVRKTQFQLRPDDVTFITCVLLAFAFWLMAPRHLLTITPHAP